MYQLAQIGPEDALLKERPDVARARDLVLAHGWNSTSYQILNPGISRWFSSKNDAVTGFTSANSVRVIVGAPVCALADLPRVASEFEQDAAQHRERVCYFAAEARLESIYSDSQDHSKFLLGAQPVWDPANWAAIVT